MRVKLTWLPNTEPDVASYDWQRAPDDEGHPGVWEDLVTIDHDLLGPNYDPLINRFFYVDFPEDRDVWYRIRATNVHYISSGWGEPFQPKEPTDPPVFPNKVALNEHYGAHNALQIVDHDNVPIADAQIRIYWRADYDLQRLDNIIGVAVTNAQGGWVQPVFVEAGFTYIMHYTKPGICGPDVHEIVVP